MVCCIGKSVEIKYVRSNKYRNVQCSVVFVCNTLNVSNLKWESGFIALVWYIVSIFPHSSSTLSRFQFIIIVSSSGEPKPIGQWMWLQCVFVRYRVQGLATKMVSPIHCCELKWV